MAFYFADPVMTSKLEELLDTLASNGRPGLHNRISITWICYKTPTPEAGRGIGASWSEKRRLYPASVVKLIYALATEAWLQKDLIPESPELLDAMKNMICDSSNDATSFVIDLLTGTTSGPSLSGERWMEWQEQRGLINKWLNSLHWPELEGVNCCQKTWEESPYGRERDFYGQGNANRNALTTLAVARMLEALMTDSLTSPQSCKRIKKLLSRPLDEMTRKADPENQVDGFLGEGLTNRSRLWSKAGWMSQARHDAAWFVTPENNPMLLVVFTQGRQLANDQDILPTIARELSQFKTDKD